jgi:hypothetical protein
MTFRFFHDPISGDEWYTVARLECGRYKAVCTRETETYKLGEVNYFNFNDREVFKSGKFRANNHSLTNFINTAQQRNKS